MKFENTRTYGWESAFRGMRNPKNSWHLSDSAFGLGMYLENDQFDGITQYRFKKVAGAWGETQEDIVPLLKKNMIIYQDNYLFEYALIGPNDMKLAMNLNNGGSEHRKFLRQIFISVDITASLYWWKEFETYKVGTTSNSTSTMHKITSEPIRFEQFELDDCRLNEFAEKEQMIVTDYIDLLETLRLKYLETKDKKYWKELIRWLPESWLQTRTITMTYENIYNIINQRKNHKLNEWSGKDNPENENFISFALDLPYASFLFKI